MLAAGLIVLIAADLVLAFGGSIAWMMAGVALWGLHMGLTQGLFSAMVADTAPKRSARHGLRHVQPGQRTGAAGGKRAAGLLWDWYGSAATFLAGGGFAA